MKKLIDLLRHLPLESPHPESHQVLCELRQEASTYSNERCVLTALNLVMPLYLIFNNCYRPMGPAPSIKSLKDFLRILIADINDYQRNQEHGARIVNIFQGLQLFLINLKNQINFFNAVPVEDEEPPVDPKFLSVPEDLKHLCDTIFVIANLIIKQFDATKNETLFIKQCTMLFENIAACGPGTITRTQELLNDLSPQHDGLLLNLESLRNYCLPSILISADPHLQTFLLRSLKRLQFYNLPLMDDPYKPHNTSFTRFLNEFYPLLFTFNYIKAAKEQLPQSLAIQIMQMFSEQGEIRSNEVPAAVHLLSDLQLIEEGWEFKLSESEPEEGDTIAIQQGKLLFLHRNSEKSLTLYYYDGYAPVTCNLSAGEGSSNAVALPPNLIDFFKTKSPFQTLRGLSEEALIHIDTLAEALGLQTYKKGDEGSQLYNEDYTKFSLNIDEIPAKLEIDLLTNQMDIIPKEDQVPIGQENHSLTFFEFQKILSQAIGKQLFEKENILPFSILAKASFLPFVNKFKGILPEAFQERPGTLAEILAAHNQYPKDEKTNEEIRLSLHYYTFISSSQKIVEDLLALPPTEQNYFFSTSPAQRAVLTDEGFWRHLKAKIAENPSGEAWKNLRDCLMFGGNALFFSLSFRIGDFLECFFGESTWPEYAQFNDAAPLIFLINFRRYYKSSLAHNQSHNIHTHPASSVAAKIHAFYYTEIYEKFAEQCGINKHQYFVNGRYTFNESRNFHRAILPYYLENFSRSEISHRLRNQIILFSHEMLRNWLLYNHNDFHRLSQQPGSAIDSFRNMYADGFDLFDLFTTYLQDSSQDFKANYMQTPIQLGYNFPAWLFTIAQPLFSPNEFRTINRAIIESGLQNAYDADNSRFLEESRNYLNPASALELKKLFEHSEADAFLRFRPVQMIFLALSSYYAHQNQWIDDTLCSTILNWLNTTAPGGLNSHSRLTQLCRFALLSNHTLHEKHNKYCFIIELISVMTCNTDHNLCELLAARSYQPPHLSLLCILLNQPLDQQNYTHSQLAKILNKISLDGIMEHRELRIAIQENIRAGLFPSPGRDSIIYNTANVFSDPERLDYLGHSLLGILKDELGKQPLKMFRVFVVRSLNLISEGQDALYFLQTVLKHEEIAKQIKPLVCDYLYKNVRILFWNEKTSSTLPFYRSFLSPEQYIFNILTYTAPSIDAQVQKTKSFFRTHFFTDKLSQECNVEELFCRLFLSSGNHSNQKLKLAVFQKESFRRILFHDNPLMNSLRKMLFLGNHSEEVFRTIFYPARKNTKPFYQKLLSPKKLTSFEKFLCSSHEEAHHLRQKIYEFDFEQQQSLKNFLEPFVPNFLAQIPGQNPRVVKLLPLVECIFSENPAFLEEMLDKSAFQQLIKAWISGKPDIVFGPADTITEDEPSLQEEASSIEELTEKDALLPVNRKRSSATLDPEIGLEPQEKLQIVRQSKKRAATAPLWPKPLNAGAGSSSSSSHTRTRFFQTLLPEGETPIRKRAKIAARNTSPSSILTCFTSDQITQMSDGPSLLEACITSYSGLQWLQQNHSGQRVAADLEILDIVDVLWSCFGDRKAHNAYSEFTSAFSESARLQAQQGIEKLDVFSLRLVVVETASSVCSEPIKAKLESLQSNSELLPREPK